MRRGEIRLIDFGPAQGAESDKRRPAVVVSNDAANLAAARLGRGVVTVVPFTSSVARVFPFQVLVAAAESGLRLDSKLQGEQIRAVAVERVGSRIGALSPELMARLDEALRLHLSL